MTKRKAPTQTCTVCLLDWPLDHFRSFKPGHGPVRQCQSCREKKRASFRNKDKQHRSYAHKPTSMTQRKCHDCGAITTDHRCPECLKLWRKRNNVSSDAYYSADNCIGGNIVGSGCRHNTGGKP